MYLSQIFSYPEHNNVGKLIFLKYHFIKKKRGNDVRNGNVSFIFFLDGTAMKLIYDR
jgi:hypothetical protein